MDRPEIKFPDPDRPEIKFPDPTRPENILKNVPRPRTGFGPVRFGPGKLGVSGCPAGLYYSYSVLQPSDPGGFTHHWQHVRMIVLKIAEKGVVFITCPRKFNVREIKKKGFGAQCPRNKKNRVFFSEPTTIYASKNSIFSGWFFSFSVGFPSDLAGYSDNCYPQFVTRNTSLAD